MPKLRDPNDIEARLRVRRRGKKGRKRYYADFRDYEDVGGKQEALIPAHARSATSDKEEAKKLSEARLSELKTLRTKLPTGPAANRTLDALVVDHLRKKRANGKATDQWLGNVQLQLERCATFLGGTTDLATITAREISDLAEWLATLPNGMGGTLGTGSVRQHLNSLSNLYRRAISWGLVTRNPLSDLLEKPVIEREPPIWLEVDEVAEILRYAFEEYVPAGPDMALPQ